MGLTAKDFEELVQLKEQASMKIETLGQFLLTRDGTSVKPVSYTHLTLPTICSV